MIVLVQPFGLKSPGGGPRILRALLADAPLPWLSVVTGLEVPPPLERETWIGSGQGEEIHLPVRPRLGRIERTRFSGYLYPMERLFAPRFLRCLEAVCRQRNATGIHSITHSIDYWYGFKVAQTLGIPYHLSVHDDLKYALNGRPEYEEGMGHLPAVWNAAKSRFVISQQMGQEYCQRYGNRPYAQVTDGLTTVPSVPLPREGNRLRIYFMGLFHRGYIDNLRALLNGLAIVEKRHPDWEISVTCRCGAVPPEALTSRFAVTQLPFGSEADVVRDIEQADLLYLPLPFGAKYEAFVRFSLSTKMISYLGSGLPILYHGPADAAAGGLLARHRAAICADTLEPEALADTLCHTAETREAVVERALSLAKEQFLLTTQRERFWGGLV